ncbi:hypothetical protein [Streptomyces sp. 8N616]|uniref:hypothetical protein n=1 Tax=Streptomyces sp. 8N616 TaxID=3457414 RepID=UPI003FD135FF
MPVYALAPEFVAGRADVPVARLEFLATDMLRGARVVPLDGDAVRAVGRGHHGWRHPGTGARGVGGELPGSAYDRCDGAGGYGRGRSRRLSRRPGAASGGGGGRA